MQQLSEFLEQPVFSWIGALALLLGILGATYRVVCFFLDVSPIVLRFGLALRDRDIAVFADADRYASLRATIVASKIFKENKVRHIQYDNPDAARANSVFLVDWASFGGKIEEVFRVRRGDHVPVIIFARPGSIESDMMSDISNRANTVVVNARGRLLNDLVTSLVTTSYDRK